MCSHPRSPVISLAALALSSLLGCSGGKPTQANFDKIKVGMTGKEVEALMGRATRALNLSSPRGVPDRLADTLPEGTRPDRGLVWMDGASGYLVLFEDDRVIARKPITESDLENTAAKEKPAGGKLTRETIDQLKKDMSKAEVEALLGPGKLVGKTAGRETFDWKEDDKLITITFIKGKAEYIREK